MVQEWLIYGIGEKGRKNEAMLTITFAKAGSRCATRWSATSAKPVQSVQNNLDRISGRFIRVNRSGRCHGLPQNNSFAMGVKMRLARDWTWVLGIGEEDEAKA